MRIALAWAPALAYMATIWALSSMELASLPLDGVPFRDKGLHFVEYALLGFLVAHAAARTWPRHPPLRTAAFALLVTILWGLLDEIHQAFVPNRSAEALDLVADAAGGLFGVALRHALAFGAGTRRAAEAR